MNRFQTAAERLRDRLRDPTTGAGVVATVRRDGSIVAENINIAQIDLRRLVRFESEFELEDNDVGFLIGLDVWADEPEVGDEITVGTIEYRVLERDEQVWRWHDKSRVQRIVFCKEWSG